MNEIEYKGLLADMLILTDSLLSVCGHLWRTGIKTNVGDTCDQLLDIRGLVLLEIKRVNEE